jgi:hypothetical protein
MNVYFFFLCFGTNFFNSKKILLTFYNDNIKFTRAGTGKHTSFHIESTRGHENEPPKGVPSTHTHKHSQLTPSLVLNTSKKKKLLDYKVQIHALFDKRKKFIFLLSASLMEFDDRSHNLMNLTHHSCPTN